MSDMKVASLLLFLFSLTIIAQSVSPTSSISGQKFVIKDRHGIPVLEVSEVRLVRYSDYFKGEIPEVKFKVKNISGKNIVKDGLLESGVILLVTIHTKNESDYEFKSIISGRATYQEPVVLPVDSVVNVEHYPAKESYLPEDIKSVEFHLSPDWKSPEDKRLEAIEMERLQAIQDAKDAKLKAAQEAKAAQERARIRAVCAALYRQTADKKISDLTVREEQQVRACQALGLYPPR